MSMAQGSENRRFPGGSGTRNRFALMLFPERTWLDVHPVPPTRMAGRNGAGMRAVWILILFCSWVAGSCPAVGAQRIPNNGTAVASHLRPLGRLDESRICGWRLVFHCAISRRSLSYWRNSRIPRARITTNT